MDKLCARVGHSIDLAARVYKFMQSVRSCGEVTACINIALSQQEPNLSDSALYARSQPRAKLVKDV